MATIQELQQQINQLRNVISSLGREGTGFQAILDSIEQSIQASVQAGRALNDQVDALNQLENSVLRTQREINDELGGTFSIFQNINAELTKGSSTFSKIKKSTQDLESIASKLLNRREAITKLSVKELEKLKVTSEVKFKDLEREQKFLQNKGNLTPKEQIALNEINGILQENVGLQSSFNRQLEATIKEQQAIESSLGLTGAVLKTITQLPGLSSLSQYLNIDKAVESVEEYNKKLINSVKESGEFKNKFASINSSIQDTGDDIADIDELLKDQNLTESQRNRLLDNRKNLSERLNILTAERTELEAEATRQALGGLNKIKSAYQGIKELGKGFAKTISDPAVIMGAITKSFLEFNKANREARQLTGQTATNFSSVNTSIVSSIDQIKTITSLSKELGMNVNAAFSEDTILAATELTELLGLSAGEAAKLALRTEAFGQDLGKVDDNTTNIVSNFNKNNRSAVNFQDVLKDSASASGQLAASIGKTPGALEKAASAARALGLSLKEVEGIADSLLQFESSIAAELEAELLTGKQINLEGARRAALMNDMEALSKEIGNNEAVINAFSTGNRIQQQAIAKAMGVSTEQMSKMYFTQLKNKNLTDEQIAQAMNISVEEAKRLAVQDQLTKSIEKMTSAFAPVLEMIASLIGNSAALGIIFTGIAVIIGGKIVSSIMMMRKALKLVKLEKIKSIGLSIGEWAVNAAKSVAAIPIVGPALALTAAAAAGAAGMALYQKYTADDMVSYGDNKPGYGKRTLLMDEGAIALNDKDTVIAGTDLMGGGKEKTTSTQTSPPTMDITPLVSEMRAVKEILNQILTKEGGVYMDGNKVGKSLALANSNIGI